MLRGFAIIKESKHQTDFLRPIEKLSYDLAALKVILYLPELKRRE